MFKKRVCKSISIFLTLCIFASLFAVSSIASYADFDIEQSVGLDAVPDPIDPQSWILNRDQTWDDLNPNPVVDWMSELNPAGLVNPQAAGSNRPIVGGLILIEYLDRKFISSQPIGSDSLGYILAGDDEVTKNPVMTVPRENLAQWWADYLNKPQTINNFLTIDEFWRENSYGKWAVELSPQGPFTIPYFEFETMAYDIGSRFQTTNDIPPSFRPASGNGTQFDSVAIAKARAEGVPFASFDFFFLLHAGYDESGVWQEFGQAQFKTRADVPYELGPGPRMTQVEQIFTADPALLDTYVARYPTRTVFSEAAARRDALAAEGKLGEFEFKLPQADWDWVAGYNKQTQQNTRYVPFTSWQAAVGEWSHMTTANNSATGAGKTLRYSTQGENDGMSTFAHEFGHVSGLGDNYGNPWTSAYSADTEPWDIMSRGSFAGPFGDHARWTIPGIEAGSVPVHMMQGAKKAMKYYDDGDLLSISVQNLAARTPIVTEIVARNIPLNTQFNEFGVSGSQFKKGIELTFGSGSWADQATLRTSGYTWTRVRAQRMGIEVVDQTGYDSYLNDHGVILSRINSDSGRQVIDSHLYNIDMIDFYLNGEANVYPIGHATQLADAAFHAGISSVDTGYYKGSEFKGDKRVSDEIVSGDTVNEFKDPYNKLNFYILQKNVNKGKLGGDFLSYQVGVLRTDGVAVGGELTVAPGKLTTANPGKVAIQEFNITNTGDAADIVRVGIDGTLGWNATILNNLYAIDAGETIAVPVYIEVPETGAAGAAQNLILNASSESNAAKKGNAAIENIDVLATSLTILLSQDKTVIFEGNYFNVETTLSKPVNSNVVVLDYQFDKDLFEFANYTLPAGMSVIGSPMATADGVRLTLMVQDYNMKDLVTLMLYAKQTIKEPIEMIAAAAQLVNKFGDAQADKEILTALSDPLLFCPKDPITEIDLIYLSNVIDAFGVKRGDANWLEVTKYDWNNNGVIDIEDIVYAAMRVVL